MRSKSCCYQRENRSCRFFLFATWFDYIGRRRPTGTLATNRIIYRVEMCLKAKISEKKLGGKREANGDLLFLNILKRLPPVLCWGSKRKSGGVMAAFDQDQWVFELIRSVHCSWFSSLYFAVNTQRATQYSSTHLCIISNQWYLPFCLDILFT